jgi:hypothetical protein
MQKVIKSISYSQDEILQWIIDLYCPGGFDCDPTYSKGNFYKKIPKPKYKFDIKPQTHDTKYADSRILPLLSASIESIVYDPPFCFGIHGQTLNNISAKRFSMYKDFKELSDHYIDSLKEFHRVLKKKGIVVFKCQDYTDSKTTMTHCFVFNAAVALGFYVQDLFILLSQGRIYNPKLKQKHARKFHSYFYVLRKI